MQSSTENKNLNSIKKFINSKLIRTIVLCITLSCYCVIGTWCFQSIALADELTPSQMYPIDGAGNQYSSSSSYTCIQEEIRLYEGKKYQCNAIISFTYPHNHNVPVNNLMQIAKSYCWAKFIDSNNMTNDWAWGGNSQGSEIYSGLVLDRKINIFSTYGVGDYDWKKPCKPIDDPPETCSLNIANMIKNAFKYKFPMDLMGDNPIGEINPTCPVMTIQGQSFQMCYLLDLVRGLKYPILLIFVLKTLTNL